MTCRVLFASNSERILFWKKNRFNTKVNIKIYYLTVEKILENVTKQKNQIR
jgi:hypothetical protein